MKTASVARGQSRSETGPTVLEIPRRTRHLVLDLPIGSNKGPYEVGLLPDTGEQLLQETGLAELHDHITAEM